MSNKVIKQEVTDVVKVYTDYTKLFNENEVAATETYIGMITTATGYIRRVYYIYENDCVTYMAVDIDITEMAGYDETLMKDYNVVQCFFEYPSDVPSIINLKKGDAATIAGGFGGVSQHDTNNHCIQLVNCIVWQAASITKPSQEEIQW